MITKEQVIKISELVKITLTDAEVEKLTTMFSDTLTNIDILKELDTSNVAETYQVTGLTNVFQTSANKATLPKEEALKNAHEVIRGLIATKGVFDRE
ncbi:MAG TPA: Asp-tRNA(Asn)/Glu-tRNA(Gln) amidotransferase subunit GatC [Candidatus Saccharimonadales bacterium]|nr:Asp-tRNA(Asn)/Glu-tRNA(Gln) amidotransferase subunit GatC [Candidatus Saccharimonadales bacterium]